MIRVLIVVGLKLYGQGLTEVLDQYQSITVVDAVNCGQEAIGRVRDCEPDVVLLDMAMSESLEILTDLLKAKPDLYVVVLGVPEVETEVIACAEAGASGYVMRDASVEDLVLVVDSAVRGELNCSPRVARILLGRVNSMAAWRPSIQPPHRLTLREREIANLICQGLTNKEIARALRIGVSTVKNHVHSILDKMQVRRRGEVAALLRSQTHRSSTSSQATDLPYALSGLNTI